MKILAMGDLHIRATPTKYRTSNYQDLMFGKLQWITNFATKQKCFTIIQPGDFFDGPEIPNYVEKKLIRLILDYSGDIYTVFGQHDLHFRQVDNTALAVLEEANVIEILTENPIEYDEKKSVCIYGASWEQKIPKPKDEDACNILVLHRMIIKDKLLFPDQTDYIKANEFATKCKNYNLIISGDNHNSFSYIPNSHRLPSLVNCGSLMRMTTAQYNHKPCIWMFDTNTNKLTQYYIPILPAIKVFKAEAEEMKAHDKQMEAFIKTLTNENTDTHQSFEDNVSILLKGNAISEDVRNTANSFIAEYYE